MGPDSSQAPVGIHTSADGAGGFFGSYGTGGEQLGNPMTAQQPHWHGGYPQMPAFPTPDALYMQPAPQYAPQHAPQFAQQYTQQFPMAGQQGGVHPMYGPTAASAV